MEPSPLRAKAVEPVKRVLGPNANPTPATSTNPGFRALLERLEQSADRLGQAPETVRDADGLRVAMHGARESLEQALALGEALIEAYRQDLRQKAGAQQP
ncbi:MAG: hypothetical protein GC161_18005 [Planctomycetaceae bacterium]|nr:hypothetical protein [Planctomycetaceae bacterium]